MNNCDFAIWFFYTFNPELHKYVVRDSSGGIRTVRANFTLELAAYSLRSESQEAISFFLRKGKSDYFGLDIDTHDCEGWVNGSPTEVLVERFNLAIKVIGIKPSYIFRSPRGIHAYWFLERPMPNLVIYDRLKWLFEGIKHIEILPTSTHSLRMPSPEAYLNDGLVKCDFLGFEPLIRHPNDAIFKNDSGYESREKSRKNKKAKHYIPWSLDQLENSVLPLKNGQTNYVYTKLVAKYKISGLDEEQAYERFVSLVNRSPGYSRRLLKDLKSRIRTSYKRMADINIQSISLSALHRDPEIRMAIDALIIKMELGISKRSRMKKSMVSFLLNIVSWKISCDKTFKDYDTAHYWECLYPGSWTKHNEGYYPLPHTLLRKWNSHYDNPLRLLKDFGVLEESPYKYSTTQKFCKYYRINISCKYRNIAE